jgi:Site-specific recombinase XerD
MSRYPFMDYAEKYMDTMRGQYSVSSWDTIMRRYRRMERELIDLKEQKKISTLSPKNMTAEDVRQYLIYRKGLERSSSDMRHEISAIRNLFAHLENTAAELCMIRNPGLYPKGKPPRQPSMTDRVYRKILARSEEIGSEDWELTRAYALVLLSIKGGNRNKEIRLADVYDIDTRNWVFDIIHVKAEDTYGGPRQVPIHPDVRPILAKYLLLRKKWLNERSANFDALFPSLSSADGYLSANSLRRIKAKVENDIGEKFDLRMCRRTFGQQYINAGVDIESVSVLMGHATTKTTEDYYCRKSMVDASENAKGVW